MSFGQSVESELNCSVASLRNPQLQEEPREVNGQKRISDAVGEWEEDEARVRRVEEQHHLLLQG